MTWNYRVMRHEDEDGEATYMLHEVHYQSRSEPYVSGWTDNGVNVVADTRRGLFEILALMSETVAKPVLDAKTGNEIEPAQELGDSMKRVIAQIRAEEDDGTATTQSDTSTTET